MPKSSESGYRQFLPLHQWCNLLSLVGYLSSIIFRLWGFSALICVLALYYLGARPRQYLGVLIADALYAIFLYWGFGWLGLSRLLYCSLAFGLGCLVYWWLTLAKRPK